MTQLIKILSEPKALLAIAIAYSIAFSVVLLIPISSGRSFNFPIDKVVHLGLNYFLAFLWLWFVNKKSEQTLSHLRVLIVFLACISYGIIIEVLQETMTYSRSADIWDVIANTVGCILAVSSFYWLRNILRK